MLTLYRSSAGSGKTRTLAKEYIKLALSGDATAFRHILAVTFANKATQEMKERIVTYLADFANGRAGSLADELKAELAITGLQLQQKSRDVLSLILHRYAQFSVCTIDAFFQRVIRSFTREAGLLGNFRLEVDNDLVLDEVIATLMDELGPDQQQLTEWVVRFSRDRLLEGGSWDIRTLLKDFAKNAFSEEFKRVEPEVLSIGREQHREGFTSLRKEVAAFETHLKTRAAEAMEILRAHGISSDDFNNKDRGTPYKYFLLWSKGERSEYTGKFMQAALTGARAWPGKNSSKRRELERLADAELLPRLKQMVEFDELFFSRYLTAKAILQNYYAFGLLADMTRKLQHYKSENNVMLLSDAPQFLHGVINNSDTPFIYEKVGSWFNHYLIDEFQDTSRSQWQNFVPLLSEAADQNFSNLIVGDVKQSVYRWRGGDLQLLQSEVERRFGSERVRVRNLNQNFRSAGNLVDFNNHFFSAAATVVSQAVDDDAAAAVYHDVVQEKSKWPDEGYVRIEFLEEDNEPWEERVLKRLPAWLEQLQEQGIALRDIAILVRENNEGQRIANFLLHHQQSAQARPGFSYNVVSNESLRLDTAWSVNVLITAFQFLQNPDDKIARAQLAFEVAGDRANDLFGKAAKNQLAEFLPEEFILQARYLTKLSLFELTEELIRMFRLGEKAEELAYVLAFQDLVLEFSAREKTDLRSFLEWWEINKSKKSIQVSGSIDATTILTVHRAKGLQFRFVLVPFCSWEMDHKIHPLLWVHSGEAAFRWLGPVAVKYGRGLEATYFAEAYRQERTKSYLDNLNLLYVAFTRAEWGLIVFAGLPKTRSGKLADTSALISEVLKGEQELSKHANGLVFEKGQLARLETSDTGGQITTVELKEYASCDWRKKLLIRRQGHEFFDAEVSDKRTKINSGILLHRVLARVYYKAGWEQVVGTYFTDNPVDEEVRTWVIARLRAMMDHPLISTWFDKLWDVKTEAPVLLPGDRQKRIDRVLLSKSKTIIIDYKTGAKSNQDYEQVTQYAGVLSAMGYPNVHAYLLYLQGNEVEEVMRHSGLSLFT